PAEETAALTTTWDKLLGRAVAAATGRQFLDRLKTRKAKVGEKFDRAAKQFEPETVGIAATTNVPVADDVARVPRPAVPQPQPKARPTQEQSDTFARLMQAKRKALEERDAAKDES